MRMHTELWAVEVERSSGVPGPGNRDVGRLKLSPQRPTFQQDKEKKKKESILDLSKYIDKTIRVKFQGGREASGILKGFDPLLNLVLDGTIEYMRGELAEVGEVTLGLWDQTMPGGDLGCRPLASCCSV